MSQRAKTIQIFLPGGDPRGIRIAEITTRIVQVIEVPRSLLDAFLAMPESRKVAVYFLFGAGEQDGEPMVYIGQTGDLQQRLPSHNKSKDFWERALILISRTDSLTQTHALYLEWLCLQKSDEAGRYSVENANSGSRPHTPAPLEADCEEIFETGHALLATLGFPLFDPVGRRFVAPTATTSAPESIETPGATWTSEEYVCRSSDANGRGLYTPEGFVVLKDSYGRSEVVPSMKGMPLEQNRNDLIAQGVLAIEGNRARFTKDYLFRSPSAAAGLLMGRSANGWVEWTTKSGKTLDQVVRGNPDTRVSR
ncbi:MAG: GIY-YIG nuclease family protein [Planctomycetaceae bacterium]|nr:GIY-YIG nuclease family protein [Planctomycetaceae bacterium]